MTAASQQQCLSDFKIYLEKNSKCTPIVTLSVHSTVLH